MFSVIICLIDVFIAWRWGDWRNWKKYQPTILYLITCDLLYNFLAYNYSLWEYEPTILYPNHTIMSIITMFIAYPSVMIVYLGRYPYEKSKQVLWISFWSLLWTALEWIGMQLGEFSHHNGWNLMWSLGFNITLFSVVRLHHKKPLLAYGLSVIATVVLLIIFKVPITKMK